MLLLWRLLLVIICVDFHYYRACVLLICPLNINNYFYVAFTVKMLVMTAIIETGVTLVFVDRVGC